ncbi:acetolactate synthase large subunit [Mesorhizobium sp. BR1-1-16]|uniref:acetolactate synthase large subunit n=1 Tax=Mesorhizobium sp. BR1-1-16 TaxID=2876653 RepID=UPI001CCAC1A9|nr:acetolactate synthase large subunit [Mesorhizobium sp. BR1-1-16]MBZ9937758.1 acetolactate synthase large subunit [Mesorhizobium sp. BR1-1-16]
MNGADRLCDTLLASGVDVCFANPGTSEMHFVAALDRKPAMRCVLALFEGVATGAADGYGRMAGKPAATLLHTGPGLGNGLANLHNARRARTPLVNIVGDHASYHLGFDAPLTSDIDSIARPMSAFVRRATGPDDVGPAAEATIAAAIERQGVATLILPSDAAWSPVGPSDARPAAIASPPKVDEARLADLATALIAAGGRAGLLLAGKAPRGAALEMAGRIAARTGARLFEEVLNGRSERGGDRVPLERIPYPIDQAVAALADLDLLVLVGAREPVAFFAYPGKPSRLLPDGCRIETLAGPGDDIPDALKRLAERLGATRPPPRRVAATTAPGSPSGPLTEDAVSVIAAAGLTEDAIVVDEALTSGRRFYALSASGPRHDYMMCTGGAIGTGMPLSVGAAIACPGRKVVTLQADGSGMYTLQALWTAAREKLDVLVVIFANRAYAILRLEMGNVGVTGFGHNADRMLRLDEPALDWVSLARGMGVEAARADTCERFADLYRSAVGTKGPFLIEAVI